MHRTQVQLTDKQIEAVKSLATKKKVSMAEIIRMSLDFFLQKEESGKFDLGGEIVSLGGGIACLWGCVYPVR